MNEKLPQVFVERTAERLGDELPAFLAAMDGEAFRGYRVNVLKPTLAEPEGAGEQIPWEATGRYLRSDSTAGAHPLHEAGAWYIQDPSAMVPAAVLNAQPGEAVLDLCAAPGGKSTQLGAALKGSGLLVCNEPIPKRAQILSRNIERMGIMNALVVSAYPDQLARRWPNGFDAVLADAPCSGEGMFRRHPETRAEWLPESPAGCAARQAEILDAAAQMVRPGGRLVYATCTLNTTENEDTVHAFLDRHPEFSLRPFSLPGIEAPEGMFTCWPHRIKGEGQFAALLVRAGEGEAEILRQTGGLPAPDKAALAAYSAFAGKNAPRPTGMLGTTLIHADYLPDIRGLKVLRCGLQLGEARGKLFVPDHAWALAAQTPAFPQPELTEEEARRYQAGETLPVSGELKGWVLPKCGGLVLGWGKVSDGVMKNHYPKGLRRM